MKLLPPEFQLGNINQFPAWHQRVKENLLAAFSKPLGSGQIPLGAHIPFALVNPSTRYGQAQSYSAMAHVAAVCGLLFLFASGSTHPLRTDPGLVDRPPGPVLRFARLPELREGAPSLGLRGGGGARETLPARAGELAPFSPMPLVQPRLPHTEQFDLPAPPAVFDPQAPSDVRLVTNLGLPWMKKDTNSAGPGEGGTVGNGGQGGMGDDDVGGAGLGDSPGNYANLVTHPACVYCPEPPYSDQARKAKLQGLVTLRVLVGSDGRAERVQVLKGLGLGLEESAVAAVRSWRFAPARDARKRPLATWVTIETRFQLF